MLHHRPVSTSPLPFADSPLLGPSPQVGCVSTLRHFAATIELFTDTFYASGGVQARNGLPLTPKQMQQVGGALLALLLLFAGKSGAYGRNVITHSKILLMAPVVWFTSLKAVCWCPCRYKLLQHSQQSTPAQLVSVLRPTSSCWPGALSW
jgi:hypothetical protein